MYPRKLATIKRIERQKFIHNSIINCTMQNVFLEACEQGDLQHVLSEIEMRPNDAFTNFDYWNQGMSRACFGGHLPIVELMISKGANNWNDGLCKACEGGHS